MFETDRRACLRYRELVFISIRFSHMFWLRFLVLILSTFKSNLWLLQNILLNNQKCDPVQSLHLKPKKANNKQRNKTKQKNPDTLWNKSSFLKIFLLTYKLQNEQSTKTIMSMFCIIKRLYSFTSSHYWDICTTSKQMQWISCFVCNGFNNFF